MDIADSYDVIVLGTGVAGLSAALASAEMGLATLVLEKDSVIGGGTAYSYGLIWVGENHLARAAGLADDPQDVRDYMHFVAGGEARAENLDAYIRFAPEMLRFFEGCGIPFKIARGVVDHYQGIAPGASPEGRSLEVELFSGYDLGPWQRRLRRHAIQPSFITMEEQVGWGGVNKAGSWDPDIVAERKARDMCGKGLGLVCHLLKAALDRGADLVTEADVARLIMRDGRVAGVTLADGRSIQASRGVVLATGGYEANPDFIDAFEALPNWMSVQPPSATGDGMVLGGDLGAAVHSIRNGFQLFLGFEIPQPGPSAEPVTHLAGIVELCSPHTMVVNRQGLRFADEAYFQGMVPALREFSALTHSYTNLPCYLIFDAQYAARYSFGGLPADAPIPDWVSRGDTPEALARALGIDPAQFAATLERFNGFAAAGRDEDFHRGELVWRLAKGEAGRSNPSLGTLAEPPFYGIELRPTGSGGAGLVTDESARVLTQRGEPIAGLYASGAATMRAEYGTGYQAGFSLAGGMTFGYLAARDMAGE